MPFCTQCGTQVNTAASFCPHCGSPQARSSGQYQDFLAGISDRTAAILCYIPVFGFVPAIVVLASQRYRSNIRVRFDAFQSLYLFLAWLVLNSAGPALLFAGLPNHGMNRAIVELLRLALIAAWIYLLIKARHQEQVRLPIVGDLAARSTYEQL